jgi:anti-sigma B factor antagonist
MITIDHPRMPTPTCGEQQQLRVAVDVAAARMTLTGELDLATVELVRSASAALFAGTSHHVTIDLTDLTFIDATGLGEIVRIRAALHAAGHRLILLHLPVTIRRTFDAGGLRDLLG